MCINTLQYIGGAVLFHYDHTSQGKYLSPTMSFWSVRMSEEGDFLDFHPHFTFGKGFSKIVFRSSKDLYSAKKTQVGPKPYDTK